MRFIFLLFFLLLNVVLQGQVFPWSATVRILTPYNTFIRELSQAGNERLQVILLQKDLATPSYQVRLKFKVFLDGNLLFETKPSYIAPIITIEGGIPTLLSGSDLSSYFDAQNLNFAGMSLQTYLSSGNVPEGAYQFCATVFDAFVPTKVLSNAACQSFFMVRAEPPLLNMPACGTAILPNQLLTFRWNNVSSAGNWEYKLELFEIRNADGNPNNTVLSSSPIFTTTTSLNNYAYTPADPPLLPNMRYAWRVQAVDLNGINQVRNNGNSLVCDFTNQPQTASGAPITAISAPLGIQAEAKSPSTGKVFWTPYAITPTTPITDRPDSYHVEYKKVGAGFEWFKASTIVENYVVVTDLEPSTAYQARMQAKKGTFFSDYSAIVNFTTPALIPIVCGTKPASLLNSQVPYFGAMSGDKIKIDGFELVLDSLAEGEGGVYGGDGLIAVEFLGGKQFEVYFEGLFINELKEGGDGNVWFKMRDMDAWIATMTGTDVQAQAQAAAQAQAQANYADIDLDPNVLTYPSHTITNVSVNAQGVITLTTSAGAITVQASDLPPPPRTLPVVIEGKDGQQWVVSPEGVVTAVPSGGLPPKYAYSDDKLEANDSLQVIFTEVGAQMYGYDTKKHFKWSKNYEIILLPNNKNYFVPYQSVATNAANGKIVANLKLINRPFVEAVAATATTPLIPAVPAFNYDISKVTFKLENGTNILTAVAFATPTSGFHTSYTVDIPAIDVGSRSIKETFIYAYYETKKIGKINISAFKKREEKVILVPVAGATLPDANAIQTYLNNIYKSANVVFTVETKGNFVFDLGTGANAGLERSDESMFGKYSLEMRALKSAYMAFDANYDKKASYLFVVPSFSGTGDLKGFMVRGRSVGFVVPSADMRTYAHELGHGVFGLEHTFPEIAQTNIDNLMSYGTGTHLTHAQWKIMHARKPAYSWFDSEEDGSLVIPPQVISAVLSGSVDLMIQIVANYIDNKSLTDIDWLSVGISTVAGAMNPALSGEKSIFKLSECLSKSPNAIMIIENSAEFLIDCLEDVIKDVAGNKSPDYTKTIMQNFLATGIFKVTGAVFNGLYCKICLRYGIEIPNSKKSGINLNKVNSPPFNALREIYSDLLPGIARSVSRISENIEAKAKKYLDDVKIAMFRGKFRIKEHGDAVLKYIEEGFGDNAANKAKIFDATDNLKHWLDDASVTGLMSNWTNYTRFRTKALGNQSYPKPTAKTASGYNQVVDDNAKEAFKNFLSGAGGTLTVGNCTEFADLKTRATTIATIPANKITQTQIDNAITKLCGVPLPAERDAINDKLLSYDDANIASFLKDVVQSDCPTGNICDPANIVHLTTNRIEGWRIIQEGMGSVNSNSYLAKNFNLVVYATDCYMFKPAERSQLVQSIQTRPDGKADFLTRLAGITKADVTDAIITDYATTISGAFDYYRDKSACMGRPLAVYGTPISVNQSGVLTDSQKNRKTAQFAYINNPNKANMRAIVNASEAAGEAAADAYYLSRGYDSLTCTFGNGKQGQFDRVYTKTTAGVTTIVVVECKGGASPLGCRAGNQQGTKAYLNSIIVNMEAVSINPNILTSQAFKDTTILIRRFYRSEEIMYSEVRQPFKVNGNIDDTQVTNFLLTW